MGTPFRKLNSIRDPTTNIVKNVTISKTTCSNIGADTVEPQYFHGAIKFVDAGIGD